MSNPHDQQKSASTEKSQSWSEIRARQITEEFKKNENADFTSLQREGAEARRTEIRERSQTGWRTQGMHKSEEKQEEEENIEDIPALKNLHARLRNNMEEMNFDESEQWNSLQGMRRFHDNIFNNIPLQEIRAGLDVRALKLIKAWNDGIPEMEKFEGHFTDLLPHCIKPNHDYNLTEGKQLQQVVGLKTFINELILSMKKTIDSLSHKDILRVSLGILRSGALQKRIDELLAESGMQGLDTQNMKKVTGEIEKIMKGVSAIPGPLD